MPIAWEEGKFVGSAAWATGALGLGGLFCWGEGPWPANAEKSLRRQILGSQPRGRTDQRDCVGAERARRTLIAIPTVRSGREVSNEQ